MGEVWPIKSVLAKTRAQAVTLGDNYAEGRIELYAPNLLILEVLNALWKALEREMMKAEDAVVLCEAFVKVSPKLISLDSEG